MLWHCGNKSNAHSHANLGQYNLGIRFEANSVFRQTNLDNGINGEGADCVYVATSLRYVRASPTNFCFGLGFDGVHRSSKRETQIAAAVISVAFRSAIVLSCSRARDYQRPFNPAKGSGLPTGRWFARPSSGSKPETASSRSCALEACSG